MISNENKLIALIVMLLAIGCILVLPLLLADAQNDTASIFADYLIKSILSLVLFVVGLYAVFKTIGGALTKGTNQSPKD